MNEVIHGDWMENDIPDKSINLIIADPPYFEVKGDFDFIWKSFDDYLQDVSRWAIECKRVLADNGCLLWWGHAKKIAYSQVIFDKYFNLLNNIIWWVFDRQTNKGYETYRSFMPVTEHCLFYTNEEYWLNKGFEPKHMKPIQTYLYNEFKKTGLSSAELMELLGYGNDTRNKVINNERNFNMIPEKQYNILHNKYKNIAFKKTYFELFAQYDKLRRPFENMYKLTDVIKHSQEANISSQYDHDTIKPLTLTKKLIQTTTRKGDLVLIPFGGSGTEVEACINTDRKYICYEIAKKHYKTIKDREKNALQQRELF